jgi:prolyl oligopeptidase
VDDTPGFERTWCERAIDFYRSESFLLQEGGKLALINKPDDASVSFWRERILLGLRSDWAVAGQIWPSGSLLVADAREYLAGGRNLAAVFTPTPTRSLQGWSLSRDAIVLELLDNVAGAVEACVPPPKDAPPGTPWRNHRLAAPPQGALSATALHDPLLPDDPLAHALFVSYADFLTPDSLLLADTAGSRMETLKSRPTFFDAQGMRIEQRFARSADGTKVPYFVVYPKGAQAGQPLPTLLDAYGGFEVASLPFYSGARGSQWLARGGVAVLANIRGGGEYGPAWHQAALREKRQKCFDDFAAVAEDLIAAKITSPKQLGIIGGSNGGLLVGAVMLQRPELFAAVCCQVPLLDMKRYHTLLAGASWMAEYGNPDVPEDWAFISKYSPYQNVKAAPPKLPRVLFVTSTRDDRVHPGHARKMAERMRGLGHDVLYWENIEGGHGAAADNQQAARMWALQYAFLWKQLGGGIPSS